MLAMNFWNLIFIFLKCLWEYITIILKLEQLLTVIQHAVGIYNFFISMINATAKKKKKFVESEIGSTTKTA